MTRSYTSYRAAGAEMGESRIYCGIHFRHAVTTGRQLGVDISQFMLANTLQPIK